MLRRAVCQKCGSFPKTVEELHPIPIQSPWHHVCIELVKMPQSTSGNNYILTLVVFFSKWPEAVPIRSNNAEDVAVALYQIFLNM